MTNSLIQVAHSPQETPYTYGYSQDGFCFIRSHRGGSPWIGVGVQEDFTGVKKAELRLDVLGEGSG